MYNFPLYVSQGPLTEIRPLSGLSTPPMLVRICINRCQVLVEFMTWYSYSTSRCLTPVASHLPTSTFTRRRQLNSILSHHKLTPSFPHAVQLLLLLTLNRGVLPATNIPVLQILHTPFGTPRLFITFPRLTINTSTWPLYFTSNRTLSYAF